MAMATCKNGHIYDDSLYQKCPYCESGQQVFEFSEAAGNMGKTQAPIDYTASAGRGGPAWHDVRDDNPTQPPRDYYQQKVTEDHKTEPVINKKVGVQAQPDMTTPVVGWIVCIEGPEAGRDYRVYGKRNTMGRNAKMDISIQGDMAISGENHAWLNYDYKHNTFRLAPGNSDNYTYINDEPLDNAVSLKPYDVIEMGESKFLFVPLCGARFDWVTGLKPQEAKNGQA